MKTFLATAAIGTALAFGAGQAGAVTFTFEDRSDIPVAEEIGDGYMDFEWNGFGTVNVNRPTETPHPSGYQNAVVSGDTVAFNIEGEPASFRSASLFTLSNFFLTAGFSQDLNVQVVGRRGGVQLFTTDIVVGTGGPTHVTLDWAGLDEVSFIGSGGIDEFPDEELHHFVIDDLTVFASVAVPEPATWAMMILGFGLTGAVLRGRRRLQAA